MSFILGVLVATAAWVYVEFKAKPGTLAKIGQWVADKI